jgi:hypothetical protein
MARYAALIIMFATLAVATACGGGSSGPQPATTAGPMTPRPSATAPGGGEAGEEPIFWRTADSFASLKAGEAYKVLFRITNGYAEPELTVAATCQDCARPSEQQPIAFVGQRAEPGPGEPPGAYYPTSIELPYAGEWEIVVAAGDDTARIVASAQSGPASG